VPSERSANDIGVPWRRSRDPGHRHRRRRGAARIVSPPESKPWKLHEFTAADLDGNLIRVFYDFAWETGGR
jgi:hypothetical protein